jgi:hypothetical protein
VAEPTDRSRQNPTSEPTALGMAEHSYAGSEDPAKESGTGLYARLDHHVLSTCGLNEGVIQ